MYPYPKTYNVHDLFFSMCVKNEGKVSELPAVALAGAASHKAKAKVTCAC